MRHRGQTRARGGPTATHLHWQGSGARALPRPRAPRLQPPAPGGRRPLLRSPRLRGNLHNSPKGIRKAPWGVPTPSRHRLGRPAGSEAVGGRGGRPQDLAHFTLASVTQHLGSSRPSRQPRPAHGPLSPGRWSQPLLGLPSTGGGVLSPALCFTLWEQQRCPLWPGGGPFGGCMKHSPRPTHRYTLPGVQGP